MSAEIDPLRYPIGKYQAPEKVTKSQRKSWIKGIKNYPRTLKKLLAGQSEAALDTPYRPDGWTARQVVHHLADSHSNASIRFRWTLTEDAPTIKAYKEAKWAALPDAAHMPVSASLQMLAGTHARWAYLMEHIEDEQWKRTFYHPETEKVMVLDKVLGLYDWHCRHHLAHIEMALAAAAR